MGGSRSQPIIDGCLSAEDREALDQVFIAHLKKENASLKARIQELEDLGRFLVARLEEFDPGDDESEREYHGHVAPALARFSAALSAAGNGEVDVSPNPSAREDTNRSPHR